MVDIARLTFDALEDPDARLVLRDVLLETEWLPPFSPTIPLWRDWWRKVITDEIQFPWVVYLAGILLTQDWGDEPWLI